jgi:hypothetical protein
MAAAATAADDEYNKRRERNENVNENAKKIK